MALTISFHSTAHQPWSETDEGTGVGGQDRGLGGETECDVLEVGKGVGEGTDQVPKGKPRMPVGTYLAVPCGPQ